MARPQGISNKYNEVIARNSPEANDEAISKGEIPCGVYPEQKDEIPCGVYPEPSFRFFGRCNLRMTSEGLRMTSEGLGITFR